LPEFQDENLTASTEPVYMALHQKRHLAFGCVSLLFAIPCMLATAFLLLTREGKTISVFLTLTLFLFYKAAKGLFFFANRPDIEMFSGGQISVRVPSDPGYKDALFFARMKMYNQWLYKYPNWLWL